jgi:hypothetical protein
VKKLGSTVPIKLQACDAARGNLSRPDIAGTWELRFRIAGDPTEHGAGFQIR